VWNGFICLFEQSSEADSCENSNETMGFTKSTPPEGSLIYALPLIRVAKFHTQRKQKVEIYTHEDVKSKLNSGNACCHEDQNLLPSYLEYTKLQFYFSFHMDMKLGLPP
jgi:hypothetical protein